MMKERVVSEGRDLPVSMKGKDNGNDNENEVEVVPSLSALSFAPTST